MIRNTRIVQYTIALTLGVIVLSTADHARGAEDSKLTTSQSPDTIWGAEKSGMQCAIDVPDAKHRFTADESVWIRCRTRKVSKDDAQIVSRGASVYTITIADQKGEVVPKTRYGTPRSFRSSSGISKQEWEVGREEVMKIHLSRLFDMTCPGKYTISFSRKLILADGSTAQVESNTLMVEITDADAYIAEPAK